MRRFWAKGGYGEHGRSCFLMEYGREGRYCMVDCGIMDSDSQPYPDVTSEELSKTDYLRNLYKEDFAECSLPRR